MQSKNIIFVLYKKLIGLYPKRFKEQFNESIQQTFNDLYREKQNTNQSLFNFITWTFTETSTSILHEHIFSIQEKNMKNFFTNPKTAALTGFLFALPFLIMNAMVANQFQPLLSFLRPDGHTSSFEYVLLALVLILLPIGAFISIRPMLAEKKLY